MFSAAISDSHLSFSFLVSLRRTGDHPYKMLVKLVSGRKNIIIKRAKPESHISSQMVHVQPFDSAANPPITGPNVGPATAACPQIAMAYARLERAYISPRLAPPVAKTGLPKKPVRNRKARSMPKFFAYITANCRNTKTTSVPM